MNNYSIIISLFCLLFSCVFCDKEPEEDIDPGSLSGVWQIVSAIENEANDTLNISDFRVIFNTDKCLTLFGTCNVVAADYSINGKQVTIYPTRELNRCSSGAEMAVIDGLSGRYEVRIDTFKIVTKALEITFHKTSRNDPYQCDLSTLLIDSIEAQRYCTEEIFDTVYQQLYGKWYAYNMYKGWLGFRIPYFDFFELKPNGIYSYVRDSEIMEYGKIHILRNRESSLEVAFIVEDCLSDYCAPLDSFRVFLDFNGKDTLILKDGCMDCNWDYLVKVD